MMFASKFPLLLKPVWVRMQPFMLMPWNFEPTLHGETLVLDMLTPRNGFLLLFPVIKHSIGDIQLLWMVLSFPPHLNQYPSSLLSQTRQGNDQVAAFTDGSLVWGLTGNEGPNVRSSRDLADAQTRAWSPRVTVDTLHTSQVRPLQRWLVKRLRTSSSQYAQ